MSVGILSEFLCTLKNLLSEYKSGSLKTSTSQQFSQIITNQHLLNSWHSESDIIIMLEHLCNLLEQENLNKWIHKYTIIEDTPIKSTPVYLKPNFNHSFTAVHEWLCCILTKTPLVITADENQLLLIKFFCKILSSKNDYYSNLFDLSLQNPIKPNRFIIYTEDQNDLLVKYFRNKKSVIIEPRPTIGIITGKETSEDFHNLGKDIFIHLGQSNRTLRKLFIPKGFDIRVIIEALDPFSNVYQNNKYANNYDYHQSVYLMNRIPFLDNGFLIFKEDTSNYAPTGCLFYEYYNNPSELIESKKLGLYENLICIDSLPLKTVKPGESHFYNLWDYPNGMDLVDFLLSS